MADKFVLKGPKIQLPNESFPQLLFKSLQNAGNKVAMIDAATLDQITYKDVLDRSINLAQHLTRFGLTKSDVISITSENCIEFTIPAISALFLGIIIAPFNHLYTPRECIHSMNISKPKIVFCSSNTLNKVLKVSQEIKSIQKIIVIDNNKQIDTPLPPNVLKMNDLLYLRNLTNFQVTSTELDDPAIILNSSGTTGLSKGVLLTQRNFLAVHVFFKHPNYMNYTSSKTALALLPMYHAYGFLNCLNMLCLQMRFVIMPRFEERVFLKTIQDFQVNIACLVPPLVLFLGKSPLVNEYDLSNLKEIVCGAAPLSKEIEELTVKRLGLRNIRQGYGLTEMTMAMSLIPANIIRYGSSGMLAPNVECRVRNIETNEILGPNQPGELCFRGPYCMKQYVNDKRATAESFDKDGWLLSGDVGYYDHDGFFYIVDRYKELIKYKGYQVPPAEIESIIVHMPQVKDCAVIGKPDELAGELAIAFVVKQPLANVTEHDIIKYVADRVSHSKQLHGGVKFVDEIPKNPTGKILRRILRERLALIKNKL